jgi:hypothetical protein
MVGVLVRAFPLFAVAGAPNDPNTPTAPPADASLPMLEGGTTGVAPPRGEQSADDAMRIAGQRVFGLYATGLSFDGFGLGLRGGSRVGVDVSGAYNPLLATWVPQDSHDLHLKFLSSWSVNASVFFGLSHTGPRTDLGFLLAYKYNTVLKHGVGAAFYAQYDFSQRWALHFFAGPVIFPQAEDHIREQAGWPSSGSVSSGLAWLQGGFGAAIAWFP